MKGHIDIRNDAEGESIAIDVEGVIGLDEPVRSEGTSGRVSTYACLREMLECRQGQDIKSIVVNIRSGGGSMADALLIYDYLKSTGARVTTRCFGYAASAATVIAQAASPGQREISANSLYLIHNSSCETEGNSQQFESAIEMLKQTDRRIAAIYSSNSGNDPQYYGRLMSENGGRGRWLSPEEAVAHGLADTIIGGGRLRRRDRRLIRNMGLPPLPRRSPLARTLDTIARKLDHVVSATATLGGKNPETVDGTPAGRETATPPAPALHSNGAALTPVDNASEGTLRKSVCASSTKQTEDPSVHGLRRTANLEAYLEDLKNIRKD